MPHVLNKHTHIADSAETDRRAVQKIGIFSAAAILLIFALCCVLFCFDPGVYSAPQQQSASFHMFDIRELEAANPGFTEWLNAVDPRRFVEPSGDDSCRDFLRRQISSSRSLPSPEAPLASGVPEMEAVPVWSPVSTEDISKRTSSWNSGASISVPAPRRTILLWEGAPVKTDWRPGADLEKAAAAADAEISVVSFSGGLFPAVRIVDAGSEDRHWRKLLTAEVMKLSDSIELPAGSTAVMTVQWEGL